MGHDSTKGWTDDRRQSPHGAEQPERRPALFQRHAVANRRGRDRKYPSRAYSLNRSRDQKDGERRRGDRENAPCYESCHACDVDRTASVNVGELRHHRNSDDVRKQV